MLFANTQMKFISERVRFSVFNFKISLIKHVGGYLEHKLNVLRTLRPNEKDR